MPLSDGVPSSPRPGATPEEEVSWYKSQYELLEAELAEFQNSSKDLEAELERDIEASETRERQLKDKVLSLKSEVEESQTKFNHARKEADAAQNKLQKEITQLRDTNLELKMRLSNTEVSNDDYERQQRYAESSLEDMESKYNQILERSVMLEEEVRIREQEREELRIEAQRLRNEFSDLQIETDITKDKLRKAEEELERGRKPLTLGSIPLPTSPRSELSPTTSNTSFDTPPTKTASSSGLSDTPTPPSPPVSEKSAPVAKPLATPSIPRTRMSMNANNTTPRPSTYNARTPGHNRGTSLAVNHRTAPSSTYRQSLSKPSIHQRQAGLPQSQSIVQLRSLRNKMQNLEARVHNAKSRLPAPTDTPPRASPRSGSALGHNIPASVTVRDRRKRPGGSTISGPSSVPDEEQSTPSQIKPKSRPSWSQLAPPTPSREMLPPRPGSRASVSSRSSYVPGHSRPGSRASISGLRTPLGSGMGSNHAPNASTDRVRPKSSLSNYGYDGCLDEENDENANSKDVATPTPRRSTFVKRTSDVGSAIPTPSKRQSYGGGPSKLPAPGRRQSSGLVKSVEAGDMRPPSRMLNDVQEGEGYDVNETF